MSEHDEASQPASTADTEDAAGLSVARRRSRVAPAIVLIVAVVMAGLFWLLVGADSGSDAESNYTPLLDKPAPSVRTETIDGQPFDLQRRKGSWVVINFFNTTCVPCVREHPELVTFADQQADRGVYGAELYTVIAQDDKVDNVREFFAAKGGTWPVLTDPDGAIQVKFGISRVPETWVIDPDGRVVYRTIAQVTADSLTRDLAVLRTAYEAGSTG